MASEGVVWPEKISISVNVLFRLIAFGIFGIGLCGPNALAKEPSLYAIELYDGQAGSEYVQLADVLINGKAELRICGSTLSDSIDKSAYGKLGKLTIAAGGALERDAGGVLRYSISNGSANCVVPDNVKFEHNASFVPAMLAEMADLRARSIVGSTNASAAAAQPLKKGVKLVFIAAPDTELAEYLLAERLASESAWQKYLAKYPSATHTDAAKRVLASLYVDAGEKSIGSYRKSESSASPSYSDLRNAEGERTLAHSLLPNSEREMKLTEEIRNSLAILSDNGIAELGAFRAALASSSPGFAHLQTAKVYADAIASVDPNFPSLTKLQADVMQNLNAFNSAVRLASSEAEKKNWAESLKALEPYRQFAAEVPPVARVIEDAYTAYYQQGRGLDAAKDWPNAIKAYQNAIQVKETDEARGALEASRKEYLAYQNELAAKTALEKSKNYEQQHDMISSYEVLASLSSIQQGIVKEDIARLTPPYVSAASQRAKEIAKAYDSVKGIGDERAVESAYNYLERACDLSEDSPAKQALQIRMQNLGDELSTWFLDRAKHSLQKPLGSGTELGWTYLKEAEFYKAANVEAVRDQMKTASSAHDMHSKLSIRVQFRDQTSQRLSGGFASQMESAIAAGLDTPGLPLTVVRSGDATPQDVDPDFLIAGDVLEHNISLPPTVESIESKYVISTREVLSDDWNRLDRQLDSALEELHSAQAALQGAEQKGNKKAVTDANSDVQLAQKKADALRVQRDSTAKSRTEDVIRPYSYTKTTYNVINRTVLQIRVDYTFGRQKGEPVKVEKEERKQFVVTSDVKPEDSTGAKNQGTLPDKEELLNEIENAARDELIRRVHDQVVELPREIYEDAQKREQDGYIDDAGEAYMRYLNVAPADQSVERNNAKKFLREHFNFQRFPNDLPESPRMAPELEQSLARPASRGAF